MHLVPYAAYANENTLHAPPAPSVNGLVTLKNQLSALPTGAYVEWNNSPGQFSYPDRKTAQELEEIAKSKGLEFHENPAVDKKVYSDEP